MTKKSGTKKWPSRVEREQEGSQDGCAAEEWRRLCVAALLARVIEEVGPLGDLDGDRGRHGRRDGREREASGRGLESGHRASN